MSNQPSQFAGVPCRAAVPWSPDVAPGVDDAVEISKYQAVPCVEEVNIQVLVECRGVRALCRGVNTHGAKTGGVQKKIECDESAIGVKAARALPHERAIKNNNSYPGAPGSSKGEETIHCITLLEEGDVALPNKICLLEKEKVATDSPGKLENLHLFGRTAEPLDIQGEDP